MLKVKGEIESQGTKIHFLANQPNSTQQATLLFVPGVMMPGWIWDKQLDYFSSKYHVVAVDPRSQGESEQATEGHYAYSIAKDIKAVVDELQLSSLVLIGWSLGVAETLNYAYHFGNSSLKGLVLVDGIVGMDPSLPFYQPTVDYWTALQTDREKKTKEFIASMFKQHQSEEYLNELLKTALKTPTNTVMVYLENFILQDFRKLLPEIKTPTLITTVDSSPRLDYIKNMQRQIPNAKLEILKEAGHALFVDQPQKFNQLLESFVKGLPL